MKRGFQMYRVRVISVAGGHKFFRGSVAEPAPVTTYLSAQRPFFSHNCSIDQIDPSCLLLHISMMLLVTSEHGFEMCKWSVS